MNIAQYKRGTHDRIYHSMRFMLDGSRDNNLFCGEGGRIRYEKTDGRRRYRISIQNFKRNTEKKMKQEADARQQDARLFYADL